MFIKSITISIVGFLVVFCILFILMIITKLLKKLEPKEFIAEPNEINHENRSVEKEDSEELIAVITGALVKTLGHSEFKINRIYPQKESIKPNWNTMKWSSFIHGGRGTHEKI